jgi:hypothetical protein
VRYLYVLVIGSFFVAATTTVSYAQTAEETAAFIAFGLEDGADVFSFGGQIQSKSAKLISLSPITYEADKTLVSVVKEDGCHYTFSIVDDQSTREVAVNFSNLTINEELTKEGHISYELSENYECRRFLKPRESDKKCSAPFLAIALNENPKRVVRAFKYMRDSFCRGRAF